MELLNARAHRINLNPIVISQCLYGAQAYGWAPLGAETTEDWRGMPAPQFIPYVDCGVRWTAPDTRALRAALLRLWPGALSWCYEAQWYDRAVTLWSPRDQRLHHDPFSNWDQTPTYVESAFQNPRACSALAQLIALLEAPGPVTTGAACTLIGTPAAARGELLTMRMRMRTGVQWGSPPHATHFAEGSLVTLPAQDAGPLIGERRAVPVFEDAPAAAGRGRS